MASKKSDKKKHQANFMQAAEASRELAEPDMQASPPEQEPVQPAQKGRRKNNSENPFVRRNG